MPKLRETVLYVAERLSEIRGNEIYVSTNHNMDKKDCIVSVRDIRGLEDLLVKESRRFFFLNTGHPYDIWTDVSNPIRTGVNGFVVLYLVNFFWPEVKNFLLRRTGVRLGEKVTIGPNARFDYYFPELIEIGDYVTIGDDSRFITHSVGEDFFMIGEIKIDNKAVIGEGSRIMPGVYVGKNAVVGSGAIVTHDVNDGDTVIGVPAKKI